MVKNRGGKRIEVNPILLQHPEIGSILKELRALGRDKDPESSKLRNKLRDAGFYLKNPLGEEDPRSLPHLLFEQESLNPALYYERKNIPLPVELRTGTSVKEPNVIINKILDKKQVDQCPTLELIEQNFLKELAEAKDLSAQERQKYLAIAPKKSDTVEVRTTVFIRNQYVVAEVLSRSKGICELCGNPAPFLRARDGSPYLEVHHKIRLADNGDDIVENALAVCPNCHRKAHFG